MTSVSPGPGGALPAQRRLLQERRGVPARPRRRAQGRVRGDRQRRLHPAARLPRPRLRLEQLVPRPHPARVQEARRHAPRGAGRSDEEHRPGAHAAAPVLGQLQRPAQPRHPAGGDHRAGAQVDARRASRSRAPTRVTSTNGPCSATSSCRDGKVVIPGVIDSTTNFIEHPEVVAQRIATTPRSWAARTSSPAPTAVSRPSRATTGLPQHHVGQVRRVGRRRPHRL